MRRRIIIEMEPRPCPRPRANAGRRVFMPRWYREWSKGCALWMAAAHKGDPLEGDLGAVMLFYRANRRRVDLDNLVKSVCDAGNGVLWRDDSQIAYNAGLIAYDADAPRIVLEYGDYDDFADAIGATFARMIKGEGL